ncbi:MAG: metallopeptidase TldD-related protein [Candidatus Omnitrophota bacterium]
MTDMIRYLIDEGRRTGFALVEGFGENIEKQEYECFAGEMPSFHTLETHRISARAFWETGSPVGFSLSRPDGPALKSALSDLYSSNFPDESPNFRHLLPEKVEKNSPAIYDDRIDTVDVHVFNRMIDRINELIGSSDVQGMKIRRTYLSKTLKKVYIANTKGLDARYIKTQFTLALDAVLNHNRIAVRENRIFFSQIEPAKIISRAFNLLNSLTEESLPSRKSKNLYLILSPEASVFLLREFSRFFKAGANGTHGTHKEMMDIQYPAIVNIVDNPFMDGQPGSVPFDDEGIQSGEKFLFQKGIFSQTINDTATAFQTGTQPTGNGFRDERSFFPSVRFSNLYIKPTVLPLKNLITDAGEGVLVSLLRLKSTDKHGGIFSAYGYRFKGDSIMDPVHFYFRTSFRSYFLKILKVSKEVKYFYSSYNMGSPYMLVEGRLDKGSGLFEI